MSTTIDLESTLIRAEALYRRFARTIEAIDKKQNFPAPKVRQRLPASRSSKNTVETTSETATTSGASSNIPVTKTGTSKGKAKASDAQTEPDTTEVKKTISPELRALLSRKVEILPRRVVKKSGEGLNSLAK